MQNNNNNIIFFFPTTIFIIDFLSNDHFPSEAANHKRFRMDVWYIISPYAHEQFGGLIFQLELIGLRPTSTISYLTAYFYIVLANILIGIRFNYYNYNNGKIYF